MKGGQVRNWAIAAAALLAAALAWVWWDGASAPSAAAPVAAARPDPSAAVPRTGEAPATSVPAAPAPPLAQAAAAPPAELLADRDQRRRQALGPFAAAALPAIDGCLAAGPGPRAPHRLAVRFVRAAPDDAQGEHFRVAGIDPLDADPARPPPQQSPAWACIAALAGKALGVPAGRGRQPEEFQEVIAVPLPASSGWAKALPMPAAIR